MSMLAEVKKKNKLTLNPRGTSWTNDEGKFGQKLLEKMGWAKGKGLGKEEQGLQEPLRIAANSDQKGVGYKENAEEWLKHYDAFEDVLSNLNSINNPEGKEDDRISTDESSEGNVNSLELQSKNSKNRVHYKMFTRGKDLSRYNDDDLACVLGSKRSSKRKKEEEEEEEERTEKENKEKIETEIGEMDKSHGLTTVYGGSLKDYFSHKMEELKKKRKEGLLGGGDGTPSHPEKALGAMPATPLPDLEFEPAKTDFSFNVSLQEPFVEIRGNENESPNPDLKTKKKKKKRRREDAEENERTRKRIKKKSIKLEDSKDFDEKNDNENNVEIEDIRMKEEKKKKMKRRKCHDEGNSSGEKENKKVSEELTCKKKIKENESIEGGENEIENERKKKKKSKKNRCNENEENVFVAEENEENENKETKHNEMNRSYVTATHIDEKRKKKKKRDKNEGNNEENNNSSEKPLKKLRRLTSEMSLELFKGNAATKSETQDRNGDANEEDTSLLHHQPDNQERENGIKPKKKLTSKKSFKELKTDLEVKLKQKIKKKDKKRLGDIKENEEKCVDGNVEDRTTGSEPNIMTLIVPQRKICRQNVDERFVKYPSKTVTCNLDEVYPGSNLASIKGYDR